MSSQKTSDAADVGNRTRLLQAATDAFAEQGFEGASLRAIADSAGVSFQLITYYFGSKEALWIATVEYLFERYLETGKGLGFTTSGNIYEQFHNHLRLLLTDMQQRPQLRKIWIQEYFANSERYHNVIKPQIKRLIDDLAMPYYREVVRLGIVKSFAPAGARDPVRLDRPKQRRLSVLHRARARVTAGIGEICRNADRSDLRSPHGGAARLRRGGDRGRSLAAGIRSRRRGGIIELGRLRLEGRARASRSLGAEPFEAARDRESAFEAARRQPVARKESPARDARARAAPDAKEP